MDKSFVDFVIKEKKKINLLDEDSSDYEDENLDQFTSK
jgi:hypothetical protein